MRKILVNATANDARGALSLTKCFLKDLNENEDQLLREDIFITVLVSNKELLSYATKQIEVIYDTKPKRNFYAKFAYEYQVLPALMKEKNYHAYLSLQNTGIKKGEWKQFVLIHTPLPFIQISMKDIEKKNFLKYKILLRSILARQLNNMNEIIVQTEWMQEAIRKMGYQKTITIHRPSSSNFSDFSNPLPQSIEAKIGENKQQVKLFYPTNKEKYKNNERLLAAVKRYNQRNKQHQVKLYLTIQGNDCKDITYLDKVPFESMYTLYKKMDALIFPSFAETLGLPLLEAEQCGIDRIVADREYAKEICKEDAYYFNPFSIESIVQSLEHFVLEQKAEKEENTAPVYSFAKKEASYFDYIKIIQKSW
ncbi:MAG: glycosyltransferase [Bacillus sp. (in: firmicutes)]